ncbi:MULTISPECIES: hypothetical protein [Pseudomonas syringae group]|uniref:hypothetical protein n=1 Tax=Pseudomonas syringae group TaxID=136849 RepID=UPI00159B96EC|nr:MULTISPECIES: hypothetical protein [Pseudomonas syringae group]
MTNAEPLIQHCLQRFTEVNHELSIFMTTVRTWFETHPRLVGHPHPVIHSVKSRIKDPGHLTEKVARKLADLAAEPAPEEMFRRLTDLSGVRVLLLHQYQFIALPPGVRIVVASPVFPKKVYRGRKETGRAVLFT